MMNITMQTKQTAQCHQFQHGGVFGFNGPSNGVVSNIAGQGYQQLKQASDAVQIKPCITRVRLVMHDACILSVSMVNSLDPQTTGCTEQNELYFWKRDQGLNSNV